MADPKKAERGKENWDLSYMDLNSKDFVNAKSKKKFLASYSDNRQEKCLSYTDNNKNGKQPRSKNKNTTNYPAQNKIVHTCELKEKKEKSGAWMVVSKDDPNMKGSISNYKDVPANKKVGDIIKLSIKSSKDLNNVIFIYEPQKK